MTKIYLASDLHNRFDNFKPPDDVDLILLAGDITNLGLNDQYHFWKFKEWVERYSKIAKILYIPGNHDLGFGEADVVKEAKNILHKPYDFNGLKIYGCSLCIAYNMPSLVEKWENMTINSQAEKAYYESLPPNIDILLSHSPPANTELAKMFNKVDIGSEELYNYILRDQPDYVICGHNHVPEVQTELIGRTIVINVATHEHIMTM